MAAIYRLRFVVANGIVFSQTPALEADMPRPDNSIITQADRDLLAEAYMEGGIREAPYTTYAELARKGDGAFTLCSLRAIARARMAARAQAVEDADA